MAEAPSINLQGRNVIDIERSVPGEPLPPFEPVPRGQPISPRIDVGGKVPMSALPFAGIAEHMSDPEIQLREARQPSRPEPVMPKVLAVLAALNGNFGPAIMLEEQKRKTALIKQIKPTEIQIRSLVNKGKLDEAGSMIGLAITEYGPRAPEIAQYLTSLGEQISKKQTDFLNLRGIVDFFEGMNLPKDDPRQNAVKSLKKLVDNKTPFNLELSKIILQHMNIKSQSSEGNLIQTSEIGGDARFIPIPETTRSGDIAGYIGGNMAKEYQQQGINLTEAEITNLLKGAPVIVTDPNTGQQVNFSTPYNINQAKQRYAQLAERKARMDVSLRAGFDPTFLTMMRQAGIKDDATIAGDYTVADLEKAYRGQVMKSSDTNQNMIVFDLDLGQQRSDVLPSEARNNPQKYAVFNQAETDLAARATKIAQLRNKLDLMTGILTDPDLPGVDAPLDRAASYLDARVNRILNYDPKLTYRQALQTLIDQEIEETLNSLKISTDRMKKLKEPLTSDKITKEGALAVIMPIIKILEDELSTIVKSGGATGTLQQRGYPVQSPQPYNAPSAQPQRRPSARQRELERVQ